MERAKASDLIISRNAEKHIVETPHGELILWVKPLSWIERQNALTRFVSLAPDNEGNMAPNIDFGGYWQFILTTCIERTEPKLSKDDLLNITPEVGAVIQSVLPSFDSLMEGLSGGMTGPLE